MTKTPHTPDDARPGTPAASLPIAWSVTFLIAAALLAVTLSPGVPQIGPPGSDKWQHVAGFALLALPLGYARPGWWLWIIAGAGAFGGVIELVQPHVGRSAEWADLVADVAGAAAAAITMRLVRG
ncbi:VanZ family protein [Roseovarius aquimarinus]